MVLLNFDPNSPRQQTVNASRVTVSLPRPPKKYYRHGWQSWSLVTWTNPTPFPIQKPRLFHPLQTDPAYVNDKRPNGSWVGAVEFEDGEVLLLGALGTDAHVHLNSVQDGTGHSIQLEGWYEAGEGDWFIVRGSEADVFYKYAEELSKYFGRSRTKPAPRVWCSWYSLYEKINEPQLHKVFDDLGDLPFDVLQVDDGWEKAVGDWEPNEKFPSGMKALADKIKASGRKAGLWLAPLIAVESSKLFREHPDWFLRDEKGRLVSAGVNWGEDVRALDVTRPDVLDWLANLMKQVRQWGFDYLKLDFLYAGALPGKRHREIPREAAYRNSLKVMREAMHEDAFFLACGTPIIPSLGLCDALRIGPDVAATWESYRDAVLLSNFTTPGTKNAIRTTIHRLWLNRLVHIDSDVVYFRSIKNRLMKEQKQLLQDLALICDFKATSDLMEWLMESERESLRQFLESRPKISQLDRYHFTLDDRPVDFSFAIPLSHPEKAIEKITSELIGRLENHKWLTNLVVKIVFFITFGLDLSLRP